jgi:kynurenine 3-monooxygenase
MKVAIIGAGPAGVLLAHYLLQRDGYQIDLYEKRSNPHLVVDNLARTYPLSLQERGRFALRKIPDLEKAVSEAGIFCQGTVIHRQKGKSRLIPRNEPLLTIDRLSLVKVLLQSLSKQANSDRCIIHFNTQCSQIDLESKTLILETTNEETYRANYDLLIGADGANSVVREALVNRNLCNCQQTKLPDLYKSLDLPLANPQLNLVLDNDKLHGTTISEKLRLLLVPQKGNKLSGVFIFEEQANSFSTLNNAQEVVNFFQQKANIFGQLITDESAEALLKRPVSQITTINCDRFHYSDSVLILGDAAHAVSPSLGQGCNSALEDVAILNQIIEKDRENWPQILPKFTQQRIPDAHALQELSNYGFPRSKILIFEFVMRLRLARLLNKLFPQVFKPFLFDLINDAHLSYSEILQISQSWISKVKKVSQK